MSWLRAMLERWRRPVAPGGWKQISGRDWLRCEACGKPVTDEASRWCATHLTTTEAP